VVAVEQKIGKWMAAGGSVALLPVVGAVGLPLCLLTYFLVAAGGCRRHGAFSFLFFSLLFFQLLIKPLLALVRVV
jgi:hypothetical protein